MKNNINSNSTFQFSTPKRVIKITQTNNDVLSKLTDEQIHQFQSCINAALNLLSDTFTKQMEQIQSQLRFACEVINDFYKNPRTLDAARYLGKRGWCIDLSFAPRTIVEIYLQKLSSKEINQYMLNYYSHSNNFNSMIQRLLACSKIKKWHNSISQAYKAYNSQLYIASICTLLPVFEGILFEFWDNKWQTENERKTNATSLSKHLLNECTTEKDFIKYLTLLSLNYVIKNLYNSHAVQFTVAETQMQYKFNRHGIVHGRVPMKNNVYDALKLFNYISSLVAFL